MLLLHTKLINWIIYIHRYEESLGDFQNAFKALRGNQLIDYKALGLRYKLNACEVSAGILGLSLLIHLF